jgi:hypothetical protein
MLKRTSIAIYLAAAVMGAVIQLYVLYYRPATAPGEGADLFTKACGFSTLPAAWLLVHVLPDKYFCDYFWLTPPPNLGPVWVFVLELVVMNALLWAAICFVVTFLVRAMRRPPAMNKASNFRSR